MKWLKRIAAALTALAAIWFGLQAGRHRSRQQVLEAEAAELEDSTAASTERARAKRDEAKAAKHQAHAALAKGRAATATIKDTTDADFAARIERLNKRMRSD